jgi:hypothetical protein
MDENNKDKRLIFTAIQIISSCLDFTDDNIQICIIKVLGNLLLLRLLDFQRRYSVQLHLLSARSMRGLW